MAFTFSYQSLSGIASVVSGVLIIINSYRVHYGLRTSCKAACHFCHLSFWLAAVVFPKLSILIAKPEWARIINVESAWFQVLMFDIFKQGRFRFLASFFVLAASYCWGILQYVTPTSTRNLDPVDRSHPAFVVKHLAFQLVCLLVYVAVFAGFCRFYKIQMRLSWFLESIASS